MSKKFYEKVYEYLGSGRKCCTATVISGIGAPQGHQFIIVDDTVVYGSIDSELDIAVCQVCCALTRRQPSSVEELSKGAISLKVLVELHHPLVRLVIVGGGHIGQALARLASVIGYEILVYDERRSFITESLFPEGTGLVWGKYDDIGNKIQFKDSDCAVIVTHAHAGDYDALVSLVGKKLSYLGMIGSKTKVEKLKSRALASSIDEELLDQVHTPIGLAIGAETPEEIAVSILAEIIGKQRGADLEKAGSCSLTGLK